MDRKRQRQRDRAETERGSDRVIGQRQRQTERGREIGRAHV